MVAGSMATLGALPVFLLSAQSVLVGRDLGFGEKGLGLAVGLFFGAAALAAVAAGPLSDRLSRRHAMVISGTIAAASTAGVAFGAFSYGMLLVFMVLAGVANAAMQISANASLAHSIPPGRQGFAFGVKQSAVPASILIGGLAVPTVAVLVGWRWTYVAAAVAACLVVVAGLSGTRQPRAPTRSTNGDEHAPGAALFLTGVAATLASASVNSLAAFLPAWAFRSGVAPGTSGLLLAAGAALCIGARVLSGVAADRRDGRNLPVVAAHFVLGAVGLLLLSQAGLGFLVGGALLAFAFGWSWPGLLMFAVVRVGRDSPAGASSSVQAGGFAGGALGPVLFGLLLSVTSYPTAWLTASATMLVAGVLLLYARRVFVADLAARPLKPHHRPVRRRES